MAYLLLLITIICIAAAQITQKIASASVDGHGCIVAAIRTLLHSGAFWLSGVLLSGGLVTWLATLSVMEVSKAYPVLSVSFVVTALLSRLILGETITAVRWTGILLVSAGGTIMLTAS